MLLAIWGSFPAAFAQQTQPEFAVAANPLTLPYVRDTMMFHISYEQRKPATFRQACDAEIMQLLAAGKISVGSVFLAPGARQIEDLHKALPQPATVHAIGQVVAWVMVPPARKLPQLTVEQLGQVLSGKITTWRQLNAGDGQIVICCDRASLAVAAAVTGAAVPAKLAGPRWQVDDTTCGLACRQRLIQDALVKHEDQLTGKPPADRPTDNYLLLGSAVRNLPAADGPVRGVACVPIAPPGDRAAVSPSLESIAAGTYPLRADWRIIVRPDASKLAQGAAQICVRAYEGNLVNSHYVKDWLIQPPRSEQPGIVRVFYFGGQTALTGAAEKYVKDRPAIRIADVSTVEVPVARAFAESADLLVIVGSLFSDQRREVDKLFANRPDEVVIGRQPVLVLANRKCPIGSLTLEQVRHVASYDFTEWTELGWDNRQFVVKHTRSPRLLPDALFGGYANFKRVRNYAKRTTTGNYSEQQAAEEWREVAKVCKTNYRSDADLLAAVVADPNGLGFIAAKDSAVASGLKVIKVRSSAGKEVEPSAEHVISGAYPVSQAVTVVIHPKAGKAARNFVDWLRTAPAAEVLAEHCIYSESLPVRTADPTRPTPASQPQVTPFAGSIGGAVAVMPTATLSQFFMITDESHHAAYEDAICAAIARDGRLKLVDRTELAKVWRERQYALLSGQTEFRPLVAADIFVLSTLVPDGRRTALRVQMLHGPTASPLAEATVPINPAAPAEFDPPLEQVVASAWQRALAGLARARARPSWSLVGVYAARVADLASADAVEQRLRGLLRADDRLFLAETADFDDAHQEVLMAILGVSRATQGGYHAAADFLLDGQLAEGRITLRVLDGRSLAVVAQTAVPADAGRQIADWLVDQVRQLERPATAAAATGGQWVRKQALLEKDNADRLADEMARFRKDAELRRVQAGMTKMSDQDAATLKSLADLRSRHLARAAQLAPDDEKIAWAAIMAVADDSRFYSHVRLARMYARFVEQFPKSAEARGAAEYAIVHSSSAARYLINYMRTTDWMGVPRGIDHQKLRRVYLARMLQLYDDYAARYIDCYDDPKQKRGSWMSFPGWMSSYFHAATADLARRNAGQAEIDAAIKRWSERFDSRPAACPHSDFFRLQMASLRNDKAGFLRLLNDMQKRKPDPKDDYWVRGGAIAQNALYHLFRHGTDHCNFHKWREGKRGIGGLPYDGYDPAKDTSQPTAIELY